MAHILYLNGLSVTNKLLSGLDTPLQNTDAANKLYVDTAIQGTADAAALSVTNLIASAPDALNTLNELAAALGNDADFSVTVTNSLTANSTAITSEATTARAAELVLRNDLTSEATTARAAELVLRTDLATEVSAARAAELVLRTDLATEVSAARAAELVLRNDLSSETTRASAAELVLRNDLTSLQNSTTTNESFARVTTYITELHAYFFGAAGSKKPTPI